MLMWELAEEEVADIVKEGGKMATEGRTCYISPAVFRAPIIQ